MSVSVQRCLYACMLCALIDRSRDNGVEWTASMRFKRFCLLSKLGECRLKSQWDMIWWKSTAGWPVSIHLDSPNLKEFEGWPYWIPKARPKVKLKPIKKCYPICSYSFCWVRFICVAVNYRIIKISENQKKKQWNERMQGDLFSFVCVSIVF